MPILGSVLAGLGLTSDRVAAFVVAPVMIVALGFVVAVALRLAFRLPGWSVGVLGSGVSLWGGLLFMSQGHLANLLSLVCIVPAVILLVFPAGPWPMRMLGAVATATTSGFAHAGFLPFYTATAGLWVMLSIPSLLRARREGKRWWQEPACSLVIALLVASALVAVVIFGVIGTGFDDFTNIDDRISDFGRRLRQTVRIVGLWVTATTVLAVVGSIAVWRSAQPSSRALTRLGLAWMTVSAVGGLAAASDPTLPGHRALLMILPLPALAGLGIVGIALAIGRWRSAGSDGRSGMRLARVFAGACAIVALSALVVSPRLERLAKRAGGDPRGEQARSIASYVAAIDPRVPVVIFVDPSEPRVALSWRGRQNQVRAVAPTGSIDRIFLLIGRLGEDGLPERGLVPELEGRPVFEYAVEQSWAAGGASLQAGAIIVVPYGYVRSQLWNRVAAQPSRVVTPGVAVLRGPLESPDELVPAARLPVAQAAKQIIASIVALAMIGGGYGVFVARGRGGSVLDGIASAPTFGVVVVVMIGVAVALVGADPAGPLGLALAGLGAVAGYLLVWGRRRRTAWSGRHVLPAGREPANRDASSRSYGS